MIRYEKGVQFSLAEYTWLEWETRRGRNAQRRLA
jgi:hypothetical protein